MHRINHPPLRNKINLTDSAQVRAWARRLGVSADELKAVCHARRSASGTSRVVNLGDQATSLCLHRRSPAPETSEADVAASQQAFRKTRARPDDLARHRISGWPSGNSTDSYRGEDALGD
jgi:hypothetical protein